MNDEEYARFEAERQRVLTSPERQAEVLKLAAEIGVIDADGLTFDGTDGTLARPREATTTPDVAAPPHHPKGVARNANRH
jgi:hypothetical protein